jgi:hypothetical protein
MQKDHIRDDGRLGCFSWPSAESIKPRKNSAFLASVPLTLYFTHTQAPMKLLYDVAFALQILLPKQIKEEKISTGRLPKHV